MAKPTKKTNTVSMRAKQRAMERESKGGGGHLSLPDGVKVKFFQPKKGKYRLDFLPYSVSSSKHPAGVEEGELWYQRTIFVHYGIGSEDKSYLCLKTIGKRCPICDARAMLMKDGDADEDVIKSLKPKERELFQVIDLANEDAGVQLWEFSYHLFGKMLEKELVEGEDELSGFYSLDGGYTLSLRFSEKTLGKNKFLEVDRIDFKERDEYNEDILDDVLDLDAMLKPLTYEKLEAVFLEQEEEDAPSKPSKHKKKAEEEDEDEDTSTRKSKKEDSSRKRKPAKEEEEDEPEEDEVKPSKRSKKEEVKPSKPSKKRPDPEDEDEDKEPEDEDEDKEPEDEDEDKEPEDEDEDKEPEEDVKPAKNSKEKEKPKKKSDSDEMECPVKDGEFGKDNDDYDECYECDFWTECNEVKGAAEAAKPKKKK